MKILNSKNDIAAAEWRKKFLKKEEQERCERALALLNEIDDLACLLGYPETPDECPYAGEAEKWIYVLPFDLTAYLPGQYTKDLDLKGKWERE